MARRILRCSGQVSVAAMRGDLGWWRLQSRRDQRRLLYWGNLVRMENDRLTKIVYLQRKKEYVDDPDTDNWCHITMQLLKNLGLINYWKVVSHFPSKKFWKKLVIAKIMENEQKIWSKEVDSKRKLRTYRKIKNLLLFEPYLLHGSSKARSVIFSLRCGTNRLRIETGRWKSEKEEDRICKFCKNGDIENEIHFVATCENYGDLRHKFYSDVLTITSGRLNLYRYLDKFDIFRFVVGGAGGSGVEWNKVCCAAMNFIYQAMSRRTALAGDLKI
jgi:hypothetical protein